MHTLYEVSNRLRYSTTNLQAVHRPNHTPSIEQSQQQASQQRVVVDYFRQLHPGQSLQHPVPVPAQLTGLGQNFDWRNPQNFTFGQNLGYSFSGQWHNWPQSFRQQSERYPLYGQPSLHWDRQTYNERPVLEHTFQQRPEIFQTRQPSLGIETAQQYSIRQRLQQSIYGRASESLWYRQSSVYRQIVHTRINQGPVNDTLVQSNFGQIYPNQSTRYPLQYFGQAFPQYNMGERLLMPNSGQTTQQLECEPRRPVIEQRSQRDLGQRYPPQYYGHNLPRPDMVQSQNQFTGPILPQQNFGLRYEHQNVPSRFPEQNLGNRLPLSNSGQMFPQSDFGSRLQHSHLYQSLTQPYYRPRFPQSDWQPSLHPSSIDQRLFHSNLEQQLPPANIGSKSPHLDIMQLLTQPDDNPQSEFWPSLPRLDLGQAGQRSNFGQIMPQSNYGEISPQLDLDQLLTQPEQRHFSERPVYEQTSENIFYRQTFLNDGPLPTQTLHRPFVWQTPQETVFQYPQAIHSQSFEQFDNGGRQPVYAQTAAPFGRQVPQRYEQFQQPIYPSCSHAYNRHTFAQNNELFCADDPELFSSVSPKEPESTKTQQSIAQSPQPISAQNINEPDAAQLRQCIDEQGQWPHGTRNSLEPFDGKNPGNADNDPRLMQENLLPVCDHSTTRPGHDKTFKPNDTPNPGPLDCYSRLYPEDDQHSWHICPLSPVEITDPERPDESLSPKVFQTLNTVQFCGESALESEELRYIQQGPLDHHSPVYSEEAQAPWHFPSLSSMSNDTQSSERPDDPSCPRFFQALRLVPDNATNDPIPERSDESLDLVQFGGQTSKEPDTTISLEGMRTSIPVSFGCHSPVYSEEAQTSWHFRSQSSVAIDAQSPDGPFEPSSPPFGQALRLLPDSAKLYKEYDKAKSVPKGSSSPKPLAAICSPEEEQLSWHPHPLRPVAVVDQSLERSDESPKIYQTLNLVQFGSKSSKEPDTTILPQAIPVPSPWAMDYQPEPEAYVQESPVFDEQIVDEQLPNTQNDSGDEIIKCNLI